MAAWTSHQRADPGYLTRRTFERAVNGGVLERLWQGVYGLGEPFDELRLRGLDLSVGTRAADCLGIAAAMYGVDTEQPPDLHVLRNTSARSRHRRQGPPPTTMWL